MLDLLRRRVREGIHFLGHAGRKAHARAKDAIKKAKYLGGRVRAIGEQADAWLSNQGALGAVARRAIRDVAGRKIGDSGLSARDLFERGEKTVHRADRILNRSEEEMVRLARKGVKRLADQAAPRVARYLGV